VVGDAQPAIHFAIRSDLVRGFLEANNVVFTASGDTAKLEHTGIASRGAASTVRVRCPRTPAAAVTPAAAPAQQ
jgi:hypothetical protein